VREIVGMRLKDVEDRLKDKRITLDVDEETRAWIAERGFDEVYGARAVARVVQKMVGVPLSRGLLNGTIRCVV